MATTAQNGIAYGTPRGRRVLLAAVLGSSIAFLDATVVNIALPAIGKELGAEMSGLQWTINGYMITLSALILFGGALGDRLGRNRIFIIGTIWFAVASLLCGLAPNVPALVGARALQGIGGALLTPASLAIIEASFRKEDRARAIGAWSGLGGIAAAIGPFIGGWLVSAVSWRLIFLINLPLAAAVVYVAVRHVPESTDPSTKGKPLDYPGAVLGAVGLAGVTYALIEGPERGLSNPIVLATGVLGIVSFISFVLWEANSAHPMLPVDIFKSRQFTSANIVTFIVYAALVGMLFLSVVNLQQAVGYSPLQAGTATLPMTAIMLLLSSRAGALAQRIGPRIPMSLGPVVIGIGMLFMSRIGPGSGYVTDVLPGVLVFGLGLVLTVAPLTATVLGAVDTRHAGIASGVNNAVARVAGLLAVATLPVLAGITGEDYLDPEGFSQGFRIAALITAGMAIAGGVLAWFTISNDALDPEHTEDITCPLDGPPLRHRAEEPQEVAV